MIEIILSSFNQLFNAIDIFLNTRDLTLGAILAGLAPFIVIYIKISKEKEKKARSLLIERRQLQIAFNVNEILEALKVESKWSIQEIESTHMVLPNLKKFVLLSQVVIILRRKKLMERLKSRKFWLTILAAMVPAINKEFGIDLDPLLVVAIMSSIMGGVAALAHVDAKKILAGLINTKVTVKGIEAAFTTFQEAIPYLKEIHADINKLLEDVKKDDASQAFKDAMQAYAQIKPILDSLKHPEPLAVIVEDKVAS
jgi:hypothetical protein